MAHERNSITHINSEVETIREDFGSESIRLLLNQAATALSPFVRSGVVLDELGSNMLLDGLLRGLERIDSSLIACRNPVIPRELMKNPLSPETSQTTVFLAAEWSSWRIVHGVVVDVSHAGLNA